MKAIFKDKKELIVNNADTNEQLILEEFIKKATNGNFDIVYSKLLDINGEVSGMAIDLKKKGEIPEQSEEDTE